MFQCITQGGHVEAILCEPGSPAHQGSPRGRVTWRQAPGRAPAVRGAWSARGVPLRLRALTLSSRHHAQGYPALLLLTALTSFWNVLGAPVQTEAAFATRQPQPGLEGSGCLGPRTTSRCSTGRPLPFHQLPLQSGSDYGREEQDPAGDEGHTPSRGPRSEAGASANVVAPAGPGRRTWHQ